MRKRYGTTGTPQGAFTRSNGEREYQQLQQAILDKTGVLCTIVVKAGIVSIRTENLGDFYLAKAAIKGMASGEIIRAI